MIRGRRPRTSLLGLQAFEAVARLGGVSRAATELHLTQSAVSRQVLALEEQLGVPLFRRIKKRLLLSEAGAAYLHDVRGGLAALNDATEALLATRGRGGTLTIATLPTFGAKWLVPRLGRFLESAPHITIELITRLAPFDFTIEQLDGAIHFGGPDWPGAAAHFLKQERMTAVATPRLAARCPTPAAVLKLPLLQITSRAFSWREWLDANNLAGAAFTPSLQVETFAMGIEAVIAGLCVGILPTLFVENELAAGTLVAIGPPVESRSAYYFVYPQHKEEYYPLRRFADWLASEITPPGDMRRNAAPSSPAAPA
ncbi:MAG: LysR family transcriptional regulator [Proteobacteria bacterium]|nr:LysR family transcriptional regulator [Pseudomonadota bacterium]